MKKVSGVYAIENLTNGKRYIGSAIDVYDRWKLHRQRLKNNTHHAAYLQRAYNKYGVDNFEYLVLYECQPVKEDLLFYEQWFINLFGDYNSSKTAGSPLGYKHTEETIKKRLIAWNCKPVIQVDLHGNVIKKYKFAKDAEKETGIKTSSIYASARNFWKTGDCFWVFDEADIPKSIESRILSRKKFIENATKASACTKEVIKISIDGDILGTYHSLSDAARKNNVDVSSISIALSEGMTCNGCLYVSNEENIDDCVKKYKNRTEYFLRKREKEIEQIDLVTGKTIKVWRSLSDASNNLGIGIPNISAVLNGRRNQAGGFGWKFYAKE